MQTMTINVKSQGKEIGSFEYEYPETMEEALQVDSEAEIFELYLKARKAKYTNAFRAAQKPKSLMAILKEKLKDKSEEELEALLNML